MQQPELQVLSQNEQEWRNYLLLHRKTVYHEVQRELPELQSDLLPEVHKVQQAVCGSNQTESDGQVPESLLPDPAPED